MVNEDIVTSLKNAVDKGETLELAIQILINSGYNAQEVQEASRFVNRGVTNFLQVKPEEYLTMPQQRTGFFGKKVSINPQKAAVQNVQPSSQTLVQQKNFQSDIKNQIVQPPQKPLIQYSQQSAQPVASDLNYSVKKADFSPTQNSNQQRAFQENSATTKPRKKSYFLEILLFFILLILLGVLTVSIIYKDEILKALSG